MVYIIGVLMAIAIIGFIVVSIIKKKKSDEPEVPISVTTNTTTRLPIKKALLVGINIYAPSLDSNLSGCVNDVQDIRSVLVDLYKFDPVNIRVVTDERATKANIIERLQWLLNDTKAGDELVFHYSGHGSQVADRNGDEVSDHLDEIICPHDMNWDDPFTDDILSEIISKLPKGANLTVIADSCHSGTITRDLVQKNPGNKIKARYLPPPFDITSRALDRDLLVNKIAKSARGVPQNHVLISGCMDDQTSADAYIDGRYNGALTWALVNTIKMNPYATYQSTYVTVLSKLAAVGYAQTPQLSGDAELLTRPLFGG